MKRFLFYVISFILFFVLLETSIYMVFVSRQIKMVSSSKVFKLPNNYRYKFKYEDLSVMINHEPIYRQKVSFGDKHKILVFGCSYAYGAQLEEQDTFGYLLAKNYNSTVYNRSYPGFGIQHMYYQIISKTFENTLGDENIDTVIYVHMNDHVNRLYSCYWSSVFENQYNIRYFLKDGTLKQRETKFPMIDSLFITKGIRTVLYNHYSKYQKFKEDSEKLIITLLDESQNKIKEKYPNARFILIDYLDESLKPLKKQINSAGWEYISTTDIIPEGIDLSAEEYHFENDPHPNGVAWNLIVNSMVEKKVLY